MRENRTIKYFLIISRLGNWNTSEWSQLALSLLIDGLTVSSMTFARHFVSPRFHCVLCAWKTSPARLELDLGKCRTGDPAKSEFLNERVVHSERVTPVLLNEARIRPSTGWQGELKSIVGAARKIYAVLGRETSDFSWLESATQYTVYASSVVQIRQIAFHILHLRRLCSLKCGEE